MTEEKKTANVCSYEGCTFPDSGVCAMHNIEVERRKDMKEVLDTVPMINKKVSWILGVLSIIGVLVGGNYLYTTSIKQDLRGDQLQAEKRSNAADGALSEKIRSLTEVTGNLASGMASQRTALNYQLREFTRLNDSLEAILKKQVEHEETLDKEFNDWLEEHEALQNRDRPQSPGADDL